MSKWDSLDDFKAHHYGVIKKLMLASCDEPDELIELAYQLWDRVRVFANRSPLSLCFDCVYIVANATGNAVSLSFLSYVGEQVIQKNVKAMQNRSGKDEPRWFLSSKGESEIMNLFDGNQDLYDDVMKPWIEVYGGEQDRL